MEIDTGLASAPARAAATLVMLRDSDAGMQVFLLKRHGLSDVLGGSYVFPGGRSICATRTWTRSGTLTGRQPNCSPA